LVAVSKTVAADRVTAAIEAGVQIIGESRLQEALPKIQQIGVRHGVSWHFIGQLQRRKVKTVVGLFQVIHSVDTVELAAEIDHRAQRADLRQQVLLEVNIGEEPTKAGFAPEGLLNGVRMLDQMPNLAVVGLMTIPPAGEAQSTRVYFRRLRELAGSIAKEPLKRCSMRELSMGMSQDFEVAIEEGATLIRVGMAIFGERDE
jgi:pyridoxal phosphate enzyme (YggS family)